MCYDHYVSNCGYFCDSVHFGKVLGVCITLNTSVVSHKLGIQEGVNDVKHSQSNLINRED